jgi:hypothetical protein
MKGLKKCIAAVLACRVYIKPTLDEYNKKKVELSKEFIKVRHISTIDRRTVKETKTKLHLHELISDELLNEMISVCLRYFASLFFSLVQFNLIFVC